MKGKVKAPIRKEGTNARGSIRRARDMLRLSSGGLCFTLRMSRYSAQRSTSQRRSCESQRKSGASLRKFSDSRRASTTTTNIPDQYRCAELQRRSCSSDLQQLEEDMAELQSERMEQQSERTEQPSECVEHRRSSGVSLHMQEVKVSGNAYHPPITSAHQDSAIAAPI